MKARLLIAGNWKMNLFKAEAKSLVLDLVNADIGDDQSDVVICPPSTLLGSVAELLVGSSLSLGAQNCHHQNAGAFTGEISAAMLEDLGCDYVILGHSERRTLSGETDVQVRMKMKASASAGLTSIICVGESLDQREEGKAMDVIENQVRESMWEGMTTRNCIVAYEPIGAIGSGKTAEIRDIDKMHTHIREILCDISLEGANIRILYGGSVNAGNARDIFKITEVGGALVGGASLKSQDFLSIISSARGE